MKSISNRESSRTEPGALAALKEGCRADTQGAQGQTAHLTQKVGRGGGRGQIRKD